VASRDFLWRKCPAFARTNSELDLDAVAGHATIVLRSLAGLRPPRQLTADARVKVA
jgi:hypothetical protein